MLQPRHGSSTRGRQSSASTAVVVRMSVLETVVEVALAAQHGNQFLLLASFHGAPISECLPLGEGGIRPTFAVYMAADGNIGRIPTFAGHRPVAERAHRHLHVLGNSHQTVVLDVVEMAHAENLLAGVTFHGQKIKLVAGRF